jgi:membrane protease YdiL (CAAX protease family)
VSRAAPGPSPAARGWQFVFFAGASSWLVWWSAAALGGTQGHGFINAAVFAGTSCIALTAFALLYLRDLPSIRADYWRGVFALGRGTLPALALAALLMPLVALAAAVADALMGGHGLQAGPVAGSALTPFLYVKTFGVGLVAGPVLEELGWRGYALTPLQQRYGPRRGAIVLAFVHAIWHLPLFFIAGSTQQKLGFLTPDFWRFLADVVFFDVIAAALYLRAGRSTLTAIVFHMTFNVSALLFILSPTAAWVRDVLVAGVCVAALFTLRGLSASPAPSEPKPAISC